MIRLWKWIGAAVVVCMVACGGRSGNLIPDSPTSTVTDLTGHYLSPGVAEKLRGNLKEYEDRTRHQVWVWISDRPLPKGVTIEDFCFRAFNSWGVGRLGYDDGVVLFIFPKGDRLRMRIQVGYGLERALSDRECVRILRELVGPKLESGRRDEGVEVGMGAIITAIEVAK